MKTANVSLIASAPMGVAALGINCRGSISCNEFGPGNALAIIREKVKNLPPTATFIEGEQIAAVNVGGGSCFAAFYQKTGDREFSQWNTWWYLNSLHDHGCKICGSIPTDAGNNVKNGELTVNYVSVC
ncbi:hypothetical protein NQ176_g6308 [Zarea fungicola]|uniref:Uncharacterized protein n=1 Tax=Zarea fungicola TaxID=93591 RepID=A0ACC1N4X6_9HYPO|nr:hypothetical protein NQ176_g6308 [Lecanicillium fungicola]